MAESERDFKGVWISKDVWLDTRLNLTEKYYLAIYNQCEGIEGKADRIMEQIASKTTINTVKKSLKKLNLISSITDYEQAKKIVLQSKGQGEECEWCGERTYAIQRHHYPIPKSKGGDKTVGICPNCHSLYHLILKEKGD